MSSRVVRITCAGADADVGAAGVRICMTSTVMCHDMHGDGGIHTTDTWNVQHGHAHSMHEIDIQRHQRVHARISIMSS